MEERVFAGLREFSAFMGRTIVVERAADLAGRTALAMFLADKVKDRIGKPELLPPPLAQSTQDERAKLGFSPDETLLRTGELRDSIGWSHESLRKTVVGSSDEKAVWHELGPTNDRFPKRSFLAATVHDHGDEAFEVYLKAFALAFRPR